MTTIEQGAALGKALGGKHGESAKQWAKRDPQAALKMAEWITANKAALVSEISSLIPR